MKYIIEISIPKDVTENTINKFSENLKNYLDGAIANDFTFEVFDNMVIRGEKLYRSTSDPLSRVKYICLENSIGGKFVDYDLNPEIQAFFVEVSIPDGVDFYTKGKFIPRVSWLDPSYINMEITGLDYVKKTR